MKYYIEYPIPIRCGLHCPYCFHQPLWQHNERYPGNRYGTECAFTFTQYKAWRDKHLSDGTEFLMELHGGEMSYGDNYPHTIALIDAADKERFQLQTNGTGSQGFYKSLVETSERKAKIDRVGFTYHRSVIANNAKMIDTFIDNVHVIKDSGLKVYVKELLILENKKDVLRNKQYWEDVGVEFRIQDFKGDGGLYNTESAKYTAEDWALIYPEYQHFGKSCHCRNGYKQILIRGYDQYSGDVLGCWQDHKRIGSITADWYEPYNNVRVDSAAPRSRTVNGGRDYCTDYMYDVEVSNREQYHYNHNQRRFWMLARLETRQEQLLADVRKFQQENAQDRATKEQLLNSIAEIDKRIAERDRTLAALDGGLQINAQTIEWAKETEAKAAETVAE